jgi:hypothetical protein
MAELEAGDPADRRDKRLIESAIADLERLAAGAAVG